VNKKILVVGLVVFVSAIVAQMTIAAPSMTVSSMVKSKYLGTCGSMLVDSPVIQSDAFITFDGGVWLDLWNNTGIESGSGNEIDPGIGWAGTLGQSDVSLNVGVYYFNVSRLVRLDENDIVQLFAEMSSSKLTTTFMTAGYKQTVTPYFRVETYKDLGAGGSNFETLPSIGGKHALTINDKMVLNDKVSILYDPGIFGATPGFLFSYEGQLDIAVTKAFTITPLWMRLTDRTTGGEKHAVFGIGGAYTF
jgi:hypothetical protein